MHESSKEIELASSVKENERVKVYYELLKSLLENSQSLNGQRELRLQVSILLRQMRYLIESLEKNP